MTTVHTSHEPRRGCGFRHADPAKGYGLYLVGSPFGERCERLPFPLVTCPCCGEGIRHSRGIRKVSPAKLFPHDAWPMCGDPRTFARNHEHDACPMCKPETAGEFAWLLWVGRAHYTPHAFTEEATRVGVSKRIGALPRDFEPGQVVYLAHLDAVPPWLAEPGLSPFAFSPGDPALPGVFSAFRASLDVVLADPEVVPPYAEQLAEKWPEAVRLVHVVPEVHEQTELELAEEAATA